MIEPYKSIYAGDLEAVKAWIGNGNDIAEEGVEDGPLEAAVRTGFISMARLILKTTDWTRYQGALNRALELAYGKKTPRHRRIAP